MYLRTPTWKYVVSLPHHSTGGRLARCMTIMGPISSVMEKYSWKTILRTFGSTSNAWKESKMKSEGSSQLSKTNHKKATKDIHPPDQFADVSGLFSHVHNVLLRDGVSTSPPRLSTSHNPAGWQCQVDVDWPEPAQYVASARHKREATTLAKAKMIRSLQDQDLLHANGDPVLRGCHEEAQKIDPVSKLQLPRRFSSVNALYQHVTRGIVRDLPGASAPRLSMVHTRDGWEARLRVTWPETAHHVGRSPRKREAEKHAKADMLRSLQERGLLSVNGQPVLFSREELREKLAAIRRTPEVRVAPRLLPEVDKLHRRLQEVQEAADAGQWAVEADEGQQYQQQGQQQDPDSGGLGDLFGGPDGRWSPERLRQRSERLLHWLERRRRLAAEPDTAEADLERVQCALPIHRWRSEILSAIGRHQVVIVRGETGSGKSTQVPHLLLEEATAAGRGAHCNVLVTQPRRLAAVSLARRVAQTRGEQLRDAIGYQVRLDTCLPRERGGVVFCTIGVVLARLQENLSLDGVSHLVIDEVHERSVETDVLLLLVRRLLPQHPQLRVVLMSASVDTDLFSRYFDDAPVIDVPGRLFPVQQYLLDDLPSRLSVPRSELAELRRRDKLERPPFAAESVARVVESVCRQRPPGAVLVFLEGVAEIRKVEERLRQLLPDRATHWLLPVSGRLSADQQQAIFGRPPPGVRKVVLATNVAETGITVDDVVYVVDTGAVKQTRLEPESGLSCLKTEWISQASASQRQGRAGRVQSGEIYRLYSGDRLQQMDAFDTPELLRAPLETVVLDAKHLCADTPAEEFLCSAIEPPPPEAVRAALDQLTTLQMLEGQTERLTPLGRLAARFQLHPRHVRLLVYGVMLRCVEPTLTLAGWDASGREPYSVPLDGRPQLLEVKRKYSDSSDQRVTVQLQRGFRHAPDLRQYCEQNMLFRNGMFTVHSLVQMIGSQLKQSGLLGRLSGDLLSPDNPLNRQADHWPMVTGALIAGPMRNVARIQRGAIVKGRLRPREIAVLCSEGVADTTGDSVNRRPTGDTRPFLVYGSAFFSSQRRRHVLRDVTQATELQVALFYGDRHQAKELDDDSDKDMLRLSCGGQYPLYLVGEASAVRCVQQLREVLQFTVWRQLEAAVADRAARPLLCPPEVSELHREAVRLAAELLQSEPPAQHGQQP